MSGALTSHPVRRVSTTTPPSPAATLAPASAEQARAIIDAAAARPALEKSYQEVKRALSLNPNLGGAHLLKGNLLLRAARSADAMNEFVEYLRLEPNGPFALETKAVVEKIKKAQK